MAPFLPCPDTCLLQLIQANPLGLLLPTNIYLLMPGRPSTHHQTTSISCVKPSYTCLSPAGWCLFSQNCPKAFFKKKKKSQGAASVYCHLTILCLNFAFKKLWKPGVLARLGKYLLHKHKSPSMDSQHQYWVGHSILIPAIEGTEKVAIPGPHG